MFFFMQKSKFYAWFRGLILMVVVIFTGQSLGVTSIARAQIQGVQLPSPNSLLALTSSFKPVVIRGMKIYPENPLRFDFLVDMGDSDSFRYEIMEISRKLTNYFLAAVTIPEDDLWVNLSPYEQERIIPDNFSATEMGRDLLVQDYVLKQITSSVMYPESASGQKFWRDIYKRLYEILGTSEISVNTFNKVWIVPEKVKIYQNKDTVYIIDSKLKVLMERDYLAGKENGSGAKGQKLVHSDNDQAESDDLSYEAMRKVILPVLEKEVNEGEHFAALRQIYHSFILAAWFKRNLRESFLGNVYVDKSKTAGIEIEDKSVKERVYQQYLNAYKTGVYNFIKEDYDPYTQKIIPRKYFSGGMKLYFSNDVPMELVGEEIASSPVKQAEDDTLVLQVGLKPEARMPEQASGIELAMKKGSSPIPQTGTVEEKLDETVIPSALVDWLWRKTDNKTSKTSLRLLLAAGASFTALPHEIGHLGGLLFSGKLELFKRAMSEIKKDPSHLIRGQPFELGMISRFMGFITTVILATLGTYFGLHAEPGVAQNALMTVGASQSAFLSLEIMASAFNPESDLRWMWKQTRGVKPLRRLTTRSGHIMTSLAGLAMVILIPAFLLYGNYLALQNSAFDGTKSQIVQLITLDSESEAMLAADPRPSAPWVIPPREFLEPLSVGTRHVVLQNINATDWSNTIGGIATSDLREFIYLMELGRTQFRGTKTIPIEQAKHLWEVFTGEPYDLAKTIQNYLNKEGVFGGDNVNYHYEKKLLSPDIPLHLVIEIADYEDIPVDFKLFYLRNAVPYQTSLMGMYSNSDFKKVYKIFSTIDENFWADDEHKARSLALLMEFYGDSINVLDPQLEKKLLDSFGGWESILWQVQINPALYDEVLEIEKEIRQLVQYTGESIIDFIKNWSIEEIGRFIDGFYQLSKTVDYRHYLGNIEQILRGLVSAGVPSTPDLPAQLVNTENREDLLRQWLRNYFKERIGVDKYQPASLGDIKRIEELWKSFAILKREDLIQEYVDLSVLSEFVAQTDVEGFLERSAGISPTFLKLSMSALASKYYDPISVNLPTGLTTDHVMAALKQLSVLDVFQRFDQDYNKYTLYKEDLFDQSVDWEALVGHLARRDINLFFYLVDLIGEENVPLADRLIEILMTQSENLSMSLTAMQDIQSIEKKRLKFNELNPTVGDRFIIVMAREFLKTNRVTVNNVEEFLAVIKTWMGVKDVDNRDAREIYRSVAYFMGTHFLKFLNDHDVDRKIEIVEELKTIGIDMGEEGGGGLWTQFQKLAVYTSQGNWQYLSYKVSSKSDARVVDTRFEVQDNTRWQVADGFEVKDVNVGQETIAYLVVGDHAKGARVLSGYDVGYRRGGVAAASFSYFQTGGEPVIDFPLAFTTGSGKPTDLALERGVVKNWMMSFYRNHGMALVYRDGSMHILNKMHVKVSELYLNPDDMKEKDRLLNLTDIEDFWRFITIAKQEKVSINSNMLLIDPAGMTLINDGADSRRLLLEFQDGAFGVLNMNRRASTGEAVQVAVSLNIHGGVVRAVYADTGYYDFTTLHTHNEGDQVWGHSDNPASSNRMFFWQERRPPDEIEEGKGRDTGEGRSNTKTGSSPVINPGGIALDESRLEFETGGEVQPFNFQSQKIKVCFEGEGVSHCEFFNEQELASTSFSGFTPVILNLIPATNLPQILGMGQQ